MADVWALVAAERSELADLCETLSPAQWDAPSLCAGWRIRDVVAHLVVNVETGRVGAPGSGAAAAGRSAEDLARRLRAGAARRSRLAADRVLADAIVHHQDVRRPLGLPRTIPPERLRTALEAAARARENRRRIVGLRLVATDLGWTHGNGLTVTGTAEPLLLVIAGRMAVVGELAGEGKAALAGRS